MGRLTTHILDTAAGKPAAGVRVVLRRDGGGDVVAEAITNSDGRLDKPLLENAAFRAGGYELTFDVGDDFRMNGTAPADPAFLDAIPLRFGMAGDAHYHDHVPLLVSPYGYSTCRGS